MFSALKYSLLLLTPTLLQMQSQSASSALLVHARAQVDTGADYPLWADESVRAAEEERLAISRVNQEDWLDETSECPAGQKLCVAYEDGLLGCLEVQAELDSCGGCPGDLGKDCGEIEGVDGVECVLGKCVISSCLAGYQLREDGQTCVTRSLTSMTRDKQAMVKMVRRIE